MDKLGALEISCRDCGESLTGYCEIDNYTGDVHVFVEPCKKCAGIGMKKLLKRAKGESDE